MALREAEIDRVKEAIRAAEKKTSAEIFAVLAERSGEYRFAGYAFVLLWTLLGGVLVALWAWWRWIDIPLHLFAGAQLAFALSGLVAVRLLPQIGIRLAGKRIRHERAHANAANQFLAHGIHGTGGRTGVLVFVSLGERYAEILADRAIAERFGQAFWEETVGQLVADARQGAVAAGLVTAIGTIGERLAREFPAGADDANELKDHLVIL